LADFAPPAPPPSGISQVAPMGTEKAVDSLLRYMKCCFSVLLSNGFEDLRVKKVQYNTEFRNDTHFCFYKARRLRCVGSHSTLREALSAKKEPKFDLVIIPDDDLPFSYVFTFLLASRLSMLRNDRRINGQSKVHPRTGHGGP